MARPTLSDRLQRNRQLAAQYAAASSKKRVRALMLEAQKELEKRLAAATKKLGADSYSATHARATIAQIRIVLNQLKKPLRELTVEQATEGASAAAKACIAYLQTAEKLFAGITDAASPRLNVVAIHDAAVSRVEASVLRRLGTGAAHPAKRGILDRYGTEVIGKFEKRLQLMQLTGQPWADARTEIIDASPFLSGKAPGEATMWAERIVRTECLVGDTPVSGAVVRAAFRRRYEGPLVDVVTESGRKFTTTPNHPMLTRRGWVPTGALNECDYLVCYRGKHDARAAGHEDVAAVPATIAEVFDSIQAVSIRERGRTAQPDFHGDGMDGDVDVLRPSRELQFGSFAALSEPLREHLFTPTDVVRASFCCECGLLLAINQKACLCGCSQGHAYVEQTFAYQRIAAAVMLRDAIEGSAREILQAHGVDVEPIAVSEVAECGDAVASSFGSRSCNPVASQKPANPRHVAMHDIGDAHLAEACEIEFDRVALLVVRMSRCHVYNLTTPNGYFLINGAFTGNTAAAMNRANGQAIAASNEQLGDMVQILAATFDDRTAWDSYQVHGQIRRVGESFISAFGSYAFPPNRPNDREIVVPHRLSWPLPKELAWRDDGEVAAAWARAGRKGSPPARPQPMTTVPLELFGKPM